jgi:hypothetical protein
MLSLTYNYDYIALLGILNIILKSYVFFNMLKTYAFLLLYWDVVYFIYLLTSYVFLSILKSLCFLNICLIIEDFDLSFIKSW